MVKLHHKMEQLQILIILERGVTMCNQEGIPAMSFKGKGNFGDFPTDHCNSSMNRTPLIPKNGSIDKNRIHWYIPKFDKNSLSKMEVFHHPPKKKVTKSSGRHLRNSPVTAEMCRDTLQEDLLITCFSLRSMSSCSSNHRNRVANKPM